MYYITGMPYIPFLLNQSLQKFVFAITIICSFSKWQINWIWVFIIDICLSHCKQSNANNWATMKYISFPKQSQWGRKTLTTEIWSKQNTPPHFLFTFKVTLIRFKSSRQRCSLLCRHTVIHTSRCANTCTVRSACCGSWHKQKTN